MARVCPEPCSRMAAAIVFIAIGVVQLSVGIILLRSRYANLLSGPNFLTAATNIAVGCVYGITGSIWENSRKRRSVKHTARRNVLASLLISIITINTTTTIILVMGDGNELLKLYLENVEAQSYEVLFKEVLACAYITSVCSPIVCIVVAIIALSGNCFLGYENEENQKNSISNEDDSYGWVYELKSSRSKLTSDQVERRPSLSEPASLASEDSVFVDGKSIGSCHQSMLSPAEIPNTLRENCKISSGSGEHPDLYYPNPMFKNGYYQELIPRIKHSTLIKELHQKIKESPKGMSPSFCRKEPRRLVQDISSKDDQNSKSPRMQSPDEASSGRKRPLTCDENSSHNSKDARTNIRGVQSMGNMATRESKYPEDNSKRGKVVMKSKVPPTDTDGELDQEMDLDLFVLRQRERSLKELKKRRRSPDAELKMKADETDSSKQMELNIVENPLYMDKGILRLKKQCPNAIEERTINTEKGHLNFNQNMDGSRCFPCTFNDSPQSIDVRETRENAYLNAAKSKMHEFPDTERDHEIQTSTTSEFFSPIKQGDVDMNKNDLKSPKARALKLQTKRRETMRKIASMASIEEIPSEETIDETFLPQNMDENSNIEVRNSPIAKESPALRRSSFSSNNLLKRMWSSTSSEVAFDVSDLIMDEDSLIGLSEDELMARTSRIRSVRKAVEKRLKEEVQATSQSLDRVVAEVERKPIE